MHNYVSVVTSDKGWILEKLAYELTSRLSYVQYCDFPDHNSLITYYVTYSRWEKKVSQLEVAYFAHAELDRVTRKNFFDVAKSVNYCVCHADIYKNLLQENGISHVMTINPGVDLDLFIPKLQIGVVGRTYHTGRKGEAIIAQLMDLDWIDWHFTGDGWPGPALHLPTKEMPNFYRRMDYILVPALYEGGPMCVAEALACGTEVIAPPIGWVSQFPHIEYKTGDVLDLRRVLHELYQKKLTLRASVRNTTWDAWAEGHDQLFRQLLAEQGHPLPTASSVCYPQEKEEGYLHRPGLILHGNEGKSLGGPSIRVPRMAQELRGLGFNAEVLWPTNNVLKQNDLVHVFNVWDPNTALEALRRANTFNKPIVFSPIYLDLSERSFWQNKLLELFVNTKNAKARDCLLEAYATELADEKRAGRQHPEPMPGYYAKIREMLRLCNYTIFLSEKEKELLSCLGAEQCSSSIIRNPVDAEMYSSGTPGLFAEKYGVCDYVLCVARIEPRKNQLMLLHALRDVNIPIVLLGHSLESNYTRLVHEAAGSNVIIIDRVSPNSKILRSAYAGARVSVLPSWVEGAPLSALESAASGASLVLSNRSSEQEYFGSFARYCDPASPSSIRESVLAAYETTRTGEEIDAQKKFVRENFNWKRYIELTVNVYQETVKHFSHQSLPSVEVNLEGADIDVLPDTLRIVFDLTTSANRNGRWTGISRVEMSLANAFLGLQNIEVIFVAWHNPSHRFILVPPEIIKTDDLKNYVDHFGTAPIHFNEASAEGSILLVCGSAWMQNEAYAAGVINFARVHALRLTPIIYDVIPTKFPFWFNKGYSAIFTKNLLSLLVASDQVLADSRSTREDVQSFYMEHENITLPVETFRLGDSLDNDIFKENRAEGSHSIIEKLQNSRDGFILAVGAIHLRKNYKILYDTWIRLVEKFERKTPQLVIVGGVAWNGSELARAFREDIRINNYVNITEDVHDSDLKWLYQNCLFTVYPSLYEGWGLPVAESLMHGKICLASNIPSINEIAPNITDRLDPLDITAWVSRVSMYMLSGSVRAIREQEIVRLYKPQKWQDTAAEMVSKIFRPEKKIIPKNLYYIGDVIRFSDPLNVARYQLSNWHLPESWGIWSARYASSLEIAFPMTLTGELILAAECISICSPNEPLIVIPKVNGIAVCKWIISNKQHAVYCARIPVALLANKTSITISFENSALLKISSVKTKSNDTRFIGVGVICVALIDTVGNPSLYNYFCDSQLRQHMLSLPDSIDFSQDPRSRCLLDNKWIYNNYWGIYTLGLSSTLILPILAILRDDIEVSFYVRGIASETMSQQVTLYANGRVLDQWRFNDSSVQRKSVIVPAWLLEESIPLRIDLIGSALNSPAALGIGSEMDKFSVSLLGVKIKERGASELPTLLPLMPPCFVQFSPEIEIKDIIEVGLDWYPTVTSGIQTRGLQGRLIFCLEAGINVHLTICINLRINHINIDMQEDINVLLNGKNIHHESIGIEWITIVCTIDPNLLSSVNVLELSIANSSSPFLLETNKDSRDLGIMLSWMSIHFSDKNMFSEESYLDANPDVAKAIQNGEFESGYKHWTLYGCREGRKFSNI